MHSTAPSLSANKIPLARMATCFQTTHSACCPMLDRHSIPQRFRSSSTRCQAQQLRNRLSARLRESLANDGRPLGERDSSAHRQRRHFLCAAAAAPEVVRTVQEHEIPRGDTAGAALIMEDVTIQAGSRDILEVRSISGNTEMQR